MGGLTLLALAVVIFFLAEFVADAVYFANPANQNRTIEPWMSIKYVEQSWGLTKPIMFDIIGLDVRTDPKNVPRSVADYLRESGQSLSEFQDSVAAAQQELRQRRGK